MFKSLKLVLALLCVCGIGSLLASAAVYNASSAVPLGVGQSYTVWSAETPTPGNGTTAASQQVSIAAGTSGTTTPFSVDGQFSATPGAFEVDVQVSSVDSDTDYQTCSNCNVTSVDATNFTFHIDVIGVTRYVRLLMRSRTNSVSITARINR
jgi:hypothetical protein